MVSQKQMCIKYKIPKTPYNIEVYLLIFKHETKYEKQCKRKIQSKQERTLLLLVLNSSFVSQLAIVLNETNRKSWGKNKFSLPDVQSCLSYLPQCTFPPMHKGKNRPCMEKVQQEQNWQRDGRWGICCLLDQKDRQPGSRRTSASCLQSNLLYIKPQTNEKISVFPKHLENAGYFSRVKSCYHKLFIFDPSSWQYPNKNNCFSFYLPSINCQVWKIPTLFFSPQNFSRPARQSHLLSLADNPVHCSIKLIAI